MKKVLSIAAAIFMIACVQQPEKKAMSNYQAGVYNETLKEVKDLEGGLAKIRDASVPQIEDFLKEIDGLSYENDTVGMGDEGKVACEKLEKRIAILKRDATAAAAQRMTSILIPVEVNEDCLLEEAAAYPVYLERGDVLNFRIILQKPGTVNIYNADSRSLLKTFAKKAQVEDSLVIANKGIYLVEVNPAGTQYADVNISYKMPKAYHPKRTVKSEDVECRPGDFRAVATIGIAMRAAFDQPRKATLRSQFKSFFSGTSRALVAVPIPSGATEVLYSLRISTSETDKYSDGKFPENMSISYRKVRFLGLPLYESSHGSGLFNTLLDDNRPIREEDAYCNMYVFRNQTSAKQFQDGTKAASQLHYDVDYSTLGTQSCNGRIPTKGAKTIYLAFENERVRYSNYIWLEVLSAVPTTEYHTTKYSIE